jgi:hypothetical protein
MAATNGHFPQNSAKSMADDDFQALNSIEKTLNTSLLERFSGLNRAAIGLWIKYDDRMTRL